MTSAACGPWTPETITEHPLWEAQVNLERGMLHHGADRVRDAVISANAKGQLATIKPLQHLSNQWLPAVAEGVKDWCRTMRRTRGVKPIALAYLEEMDPYVVGLVGLRGILNGLSTGQERKLNALMPLATTVGEFLEHEEQVRLWEKQEPNLYHAQRLELDRNMATDTHRRRVNINRFNHLLAQGVFSFNWEPWGAYNHFWVGVEVVKIVMRITQWFDLVADPLHVCKPGKVNKPRLVILPKPQLMEWLAKAIDQMEANSPAYMPTVVPPQRWEGSTRGGYWTPYVKAPKLVRFKTLQEEQRRHAEAEYDAIAMPAVYDALHFLQEVPWQVNREVYAAAMHVISKDLGVAGIPLFKALELPVRPWADMEKEQQDAWIEAHPEEHKAWKRSCGPIYRKNAKAWAQSKAPSNTMRVALQLLDRTFYFPHMMDFRGRMYPIPRGLDPQGKDLARGLLQFAEGKPLGVSGVRWLAIHLASVWGNDKVSFADRVAFVREREDLWRQIASDPIGNLYLWQDADKPFQTLAACLDWVGYLDEGEGFVSHIPVSVDGTCNGVQHLSAMTRDAVAGAHVNLVPREKPADIYKFVADLLRDDIERISRNSCGLPKEQADYWLTLLGGDWSRKLTKRQVMVVPYGGTKDSFFDYTREYLSEAFPAEWDVREPDEDERSRKGKLLAFLALRMWDVVREAIPGGTEVMDWLQKCAKAASTGNQPIYWEAASGFVVRHFYGRQKPTKVHLKLDGRMTSLTRLVATEQLDVVSQLRGISPNFVHSQDAAALTLSINKARAKGVTAFTSVHDAYGSHAADMDVVACCLREAFVELHSGDVLGSFRRSCQGLIVDQLIATGKAEDPLVAAELANEMLPALPRKGELDLGGVLQSDYFFA